MRSFIQFDEIDSTNSYALRNIVDLPDKQIIIASMQTLGRGRLDRKWLSDTKDNIYMSIVLKPSDKIDINLPLANITQYMSLTICKLLESYGVNAEIKWPNDVLVDGKKIAGILSEMSTQGQNLKGFVLGVGINLNKTRDEIALIDQPATSLNLLLNKSVNKEAFIEVLVEEFFKDYEIFMQKGFMFIKDEYIKRSSYIGRDIMIKAPIGNDKGVLQGINNDGSLLMFSNNEEKTVTIGDLICL